MRYFGGCGSGAVEQREAEGRGTAEAVQFDRMIGKQNKYVC